MKAKYKMTGCARFAIFLIILAPIAYFGSKYLRDSGTWDKIKDKVESTESNSVEDAMKDKSGDDILRDIERGSSTNQNDRSTSSSRDNAELENNQEIIREQERRIQELERQNRELQNQRSQVESRSQTDSRTTSPPVSSQRESSSTNTRSNDNRTTAPGGAPSLDDLLSEADQNLGTTSSSSSDRSNTNLGGAKRTLETYSFTFQNISGALEFYQQDGRLFSRTVYNGSTRVDISELVRQDDKFIVRNSPTGEYYVLRRDGDLDAYDENGYQTTCRRQ